MSKRRLYFPSTLQAQSVIEVAGDQAHYLINVIRVKPDSTIFLFNDSGYEFPCSVQSIRNKKVHLRVGDADQPSTESALQTWLIQSIAKGERMDYCVQKAVELGVSRIVPVFTERTIVKLDQKRAQRRRHHWQKIAISASEQSGRLVTPTIKTPRSLNYFLENDLPESATLLALHTSGECQSISKISHDNDRPVLLFIGPEGGFCESEIDLLKEKEAQCVSLGTRTLRSETAGIIALAVCQMQWGDMS